MNESLPPATPLPDEPRSLSSRRWRFFESAERQAPRRSEWRRKAEFFHAEDTNYLRFLIPPGLRVLDLGCGMGEMLASLKPSYGVGIDFSPAMIEGARRQHPDLVFHVGDVEDPAVISGIAGPFDVILMVDTMGWLDDCQGALERLHPLCTRSTRLVIAYYSHVWHPLLRLAETLGLKAPLPSQNLLPPAQVRALAALAGFDEVKSERRLLSPFRLLGLGRFINRFLSPLPIIRQLALRHYHVSRSLVHDGDETPGSATVVIPARNEKGNIQAAVDRIPRFSEDLEIIFVEGHSNDGTLEEMNRVKAAYPHYDIKVMVQPGIGKADAVFAAFAVARGDIIMILDADLTVPPEQLPKFYAAIRSGLGEFINGTRLVYPMDSEAMRFLNLVANRLFSILFSWLLGQRFTDTLCGTKALRRTDYARLAEGRSYFGDFDPFGDFDLIFGAAKLNLKIIEVPIRYVDRTYGETKISRVRHGLMLMKMAAVALLKIKAL